MLRSKNVSLVLLVVLITASLLGCQSNATSVPASDEKNITIVIAETRHLSIRSLPIPDMMPW